MTTIRIAAMFCLIILIGLLVAYLYHDSIKDLIGKARNKRPVKKLKKPFDNSPEELQNAPTLYIKLPDWETYKHYTMKKTPITIGSGKGADVLIVDDKKVEPRHAKIQKVTNKGRPYYEFINLAKINPTEYRNKSSRNKDYEIMFFKDRQELGHDENFYVGDTKILIRTPVGTHGHTDTDKAKIKPGNQGGKAGSGRKVNEAEISGKTANDEETTRKWGRVQDYKTPEEDRINIHNTEAYKFDV